MKIKKYIDNLFQYLFQYINKGYNNIFIFLIGAIILAVINAGIALLIKDLYYFPDVFFGIKINVINLGIFYFVIYLIWKIVMKYINDFF